MKSLARTLCCLCLLAPWIGACATGARTGTQSAVTETEAHAPVAAAEAHDVVAEAKEAVLRKDYATARQLLEQPAQAGDTVAEDMLGHMLLFGRGGPIDATKAETLLRSAAEKGRPEAQNSMGVLYMTGINGVIDPVLGIGWFRKAADQGHPYAMFNMGRAAEQGLGVKKSRTDALAWYAQAALKGGEAAKIRLEEMRDAQAPPNKKRNMAYQLGSKTQAPQRLLKDTTPDPAPATPSDGKTDADRLEIRTVRLSRDRQNVTLSFRLVNKDRPTPCQGELRLALLLPDNSRTPLETADTAFNIKSFVAKNLTLPLPADVPDGSHLLIEALSGGNVLYSSRLALPKR